MRHFLFLLAISACAQPAPDHLIQQLADHLKPLANFPKSESAIINPLDLAPRYRTALRNTAAFHRPSQNAVMRSFADEISVAYSRPILSWGFTYTFTTSLVGRTLAPEPLHRVLRQILQLIDQAGNPDRQTLAAQLQLSLTDLGLALPDANIVVANLLHSLEIISAPPPLRVIPIPPARRLSTNSSAL